MSSSPRLAIIIPTCNRPQQLWDCVCSILLQMRMTTDHIYIVNDGEPKSVVDWTFKVHIVTVIEHCKDYYARASAVNAGLELAIKDGHDYGLILDDDCTLHRDALHYHRGAWNSGPEAFAKTLYVGAIHQAPHYIDPRLAPEYGGLRAALMRYGGTVNLSFPLKAMMESGGFDVRFDGQWGFEDAELYSRLILRDGWEVTYIRNAIADHEFKDPATASYSRKIFNKNMDLYEDLAAAYRNKEE